MLGIVTGLGALLSGAVAKMWLWIDKRIQDCEADRTSLHATITTMSGELQDISRTVGHMEGQLATIKVRNEIIDKEKR